MNRGADHATTFHDKDDYYAFISLFLQLHRRYRFEIHAYCIMPNHYHILINTPLPNLSTGMRHLNGLYTQYYNKKYKKDGALFRGRYKAILIDAESYLLRVSRYIHLNPVKSRLVKHPGEYYWSSYRFYSQHNGMQPDWLYTSEILLRFGDKQQKNKYSLFVLEETDQELETFYLKVKLLPILGSDLFCKQISETILTNINKTKDIPDQQNVCTIPDLLKICKLVSKYYNVSIDSLYCANYTKGNLPRKIAIYLSAELSNKKFNFIADFFKNISVAGVSQVVSRINKLKISAPFINNDISILSGIIQS